MMVVRLALRELLRSWKFGIFFIFNLSLGLSGFMALEAFKYSLDQQLNQSARAILSADIAVSARRELTESEKLSLKQVIPSQASTSQVYEFFAMMSSAKGSRLVLVKAIDESYPFYGQIEMESGRSFKQNDAKDILKDPHAWIYPELKDQLGLVVNDEIQVGELSLKISEIIEKDETQTFRAASLAPRIFISRHLLPQSGLLQFGSTFTVVELFKLPTDTDVEVLTQNIYKAIPDPAVNILTPETASEASGRQLRYLSDYLGLVAIVALFLSSLGAAYVYRLFLNSRIKEVAILRSLGLKPLYAVLVYVLQASFLGILTAIPTVLAGVLLLPVLQTALESFVPFKLELALTMKSVGVAFLMALLGSLFICLPFLVKIYDLKTSQLFSEDKFATPEGGGRWWAYLPAAVLFFLLAIYQSNSLMIGGLFIGALFLIILILSVSGYVLIRWGTRVLKFQKWSTRYSFLGLSRRAGVSLSVFVALGLGSLLINILPQLKNSLQSEFQMEEGSKVPSLFMFDIQDDQLTSLEKFLEDKEVEPLATSPMVRARILKINDEDYERTTGKGGFKTREEENEARMRNRGVNLSYRRNLSSSESLVEGRDFSGVYDEEAGGLPELSLESRFASRMGIVLGDKMTFDVQGLEIQGVVHNLRKVKWTSFQPNFFIQFQDGVLNEAPKTYIVALPSLSKEKRVEIQNELAKAFPNISIIDVVRTVNDALAVGEKMSWSLELMAYLSVLTGYIVLYSIVRGQVRTRRWELNMLKVMGAQSGALSKFVVVEFIYLSFFASLIGSFLSVFVGFVLNFYIFQSDFVPSFQAPVTTVVLLTALSMLIAYLASRSVIKEKPLVILRESR